MDIISNLQRRKLLGEVAMNILEYLSVSDLHAAEKVSLDWSQAVFNGKLWEKHFKRNISLYPPWRKMFNILLKQNMRTFTSADNKDDFWSEQMRYREMCLTIHQSLEVLDSNWISGNYEEEDVHRGPTIGPVNSITFLMDEKHIVRHLDSERVFKFYNRWSLELEEVIPSRCDLVGNHADRYFVTCFDFSDEILVIGYGNGVVDVVKRKTTETLHTFRDFDWPNNYSLEEPQDSYATEKVIISPKRQFLLSYLYTSTAFFLTLRKIKNLTEMTIAHQFQLDENIEELVNLFMDDSYTVLYIRASTGRGNSEDVFEIRSTDSFNILHSFEIKDVVSAYHYSNGLLVIGSQFGNNQFLSIWDTNSGKTLRKMKLDKEKIVDLRVVSDKYIVSVNDSGELKQWDLRSVIDRSLPCDKAMLHTIGSSRVLSSCLGGGMAADEYQVVLFGFFRTVSKGHNENPIIVLLDFMKGLNRLKKPLSALY